MGGASIKPPDGTCCRCAALEERLVGWCVSNAAVVVRQAQASLLSPQRRAASPGSGRAPSEADGAAQSPALASIPPVSLVWQEKQNLTALLPNTQHQGETEFNSLTPGFILRRTGFLPSHVSCLIQPAAAWRRRVHLGGVDFGAFSSGWVLRRNSVSFLEICRNSIL